MYNPFSILHYLDKGRFSNYWFETGTPTFLIELFKARRYYIPQLDEIQASESLIGSFDIDYIEVENILFQAGYLTIQSYQMKGNRIIYTLTYPNLEVRLSLTDYILKYYSHDVGIKERNQSRLYDCLVEGKVDCIKKIMQSHFASIPNDCYRKNG